MIFSINRRHFDQRTGFTPSDLPHQNCYTAALGIPAGQKVLVQKPGSLYRPSLTDTFLARAGLLMTPDSSIDSLKTRILKDKLIEADLSDLHQGYNLLGAWSCAAEDDPDGLGDFHIRTYFPDGTISEAPGLNSQERIVPHGHENEIIVRYVQNIDVCHVMRSRRYMFAGFFRQSGEGTDISFARW